MSLENEDLQLFREQVRRFIAREIVPHHFRWEEEGIVPRSLWRAAGSAGLLCCTVSQEYGGAGADYSASAIVIEELGRVGASGPGFIIHSEMAVPYIQNHGSELQKQKWLPRLVAGEAIAGVAMTEPGAGSDLRAIATRARRTTQGYVLSGQKVFISNGQLADVFVVAAKIQDTDRISLFLVDAQLEGFRRGRNLSKIGGKAQDTSELFFDDVLVPSLDILGEEGDGFNLLVHGLARERLTICISCQARAEAILKETLEYASQRRLFGQSLLSFQNTRFKLAEVKADLVAGRALVDYLLSQYLTGCLDGATAAAGKLWTSEMLGRTADVCLQLHGGWGYMWEQPIARAYADARVERLAGGTSEVMKEIIARAL